MCVWRVGASPSPGGLRQRRSEVGKEHGQPARGILRIKAQKTEDGSHHVELPLTGGVGGNSRRGSWRSACASHLVRHA